VRAVKRLTTDVVPLRGEPYNRGKNREEQTVPELPEVETVVRDLQPRLTGRRLATVEVSDQALRRPWSPDWHQTLAGQRVREVRRRGKWIVLTLNGEVSLVIHLGMTGQLKVMPATAPREPHTHLVFALDRGREQLRFRDIRRFGSATVFTSGDELANFFEGARLGPEPFELDPKVWRQRLASTSRCLKAVLLDQRVVAGVGNIYADEALFTARLHPARTARDLSAAEARRLREAIVEVLTTAIEKRGSSIRNYVGGSGMQGEYQKEFRVYGCTGQPCGRCGELIACTRLAGRSTHFCPRCQRK
jgi:formamidopyrimidine-DNA glycosylase